MKEHTKTIKTQAITFFTALSLKLQYENIYLIVCELSMINIMEVSDNKIV